MVPLQPSGFSAAIPSALLVSASERRPGGWLAVRSPRFRSGVEGPWTSEPSGRGGRQLLEDHPDRVFSVPSQRGRPLAAWQGLAEFSRGPRGL